MQSYKITEDAKVDLIEIAHYTLNKWGKDTFIKYRNGLEKAFNAIAKQTSIKKIFSEKLSDVFVKKYKHHYIFYINQKNTVIIIAVIHEKRDILSHLTRRLES